MCAPFHGTHKSTINFTKIAKGSEANKQKRIKKSSVQLLCVNTLTVPCALSLLQNYCERVRCCVGLLNILFTKRYSYMKIHISAAFRKHWTLEFWGYSSRLWVAWAEETTSGGTGIIIRLHKYFSGFNVEADQERKHFLWRCVFSPLLLIEI